MSEALVCGDEAPSYQIQPNLLQVAPGEIVLHYCAEMRGVWKAWACRLSALSGLMAEGGECSTQSSGDH